MSELRRKAGWNQLEDALEAAGIDREVFAHLAAREVQATWQSPDRAEPSSAFTAEEAEVLRRFDLSARRPDEPDVVTQTAAGRAVMEARAATVEEVAGALNVSRARVRQRAAERTLYALRDGDEWRFPRWQFDATGRPIPGIAQVVRELPKGLHPVAVWRFLSEPSPDLEIGDAAVSPLQWLGGGGDPEPVAAIAREL